MQGGIADALLAKGRAQDDAPLQCSPAVMFVSPSAASR